jgi:hypothetical protein
VLHQYVLMQNHTHLVIETPCGHQPAATPVRGPGGRQPQAAKSGEEV